MKKNISILGAIIIILTSTIVHAGKADIVDDLMAIEKRLEVWLGSSRHAVDEDLADALTRTIDLLGSAPSPENTSIEAISSTPHYLLLKRAKQAISGQKEDRLRNDIQDLKNLLFIERMIRMAPPEVNSFASLEEYTHERLKEVKAVEQTAVLTSTRELSFSLEQLTLNELKQDLARQRETIAHDTQRLIDPLLKEELTLAEELDVINAQLTTLEEQIKTPIDPGQLCREYEQQEEKEWQKFSRAGIKTFSDACERHKTEVATRLGQLQRQLDNLPHRGNLRTTIEKNNNLAERQRLVEEMAPFRHLTDNIQFIISQQPQVQTFSDELRPIIREAIIQATKTPSFDAEREVFSLLYCLLRTDAAMRERNCRSVKELSAITPPPCEHWAIGDSLTQLNQRQSKIEASINTKKAKRPQELREQEQKLRQGTRSITERTIVLKQEQTVIESKQSAKDHDIAEKLKIITALQKNLFERIKKVNLSDQFRKEKELEAKTNARNEERHALKTTRDMLTAERALLNDERAHATQRKEETKKALLDERRRVRAIEQMLRQEQGTLDEQRNREEQLRAREELLTKQYAEFTAREKAAHNVSTTSCPLATSTAPFLVTGPVEPFTFYRILEHASRGYTGSITNSTLLGEQEQYDEYVLRSVITQAAHDGSLNAFTGWREGGDTQLPPATMLHRAEINNHRSLAQLLHDLQLFPDYNPAAHALIDAILHRDASVTHNRLVEGASRRLQVGPQGDWPVHVLARRADLKPYTQPHQLYIDWIQDLLKEPTNSGYLATLTNAMGDTPLMVAIREHSPLRQELLSLLTGAGIISSRDRNNNTLLHLAFMYHEETDTLTMPSLVINSMERLLSPTQQIQLLTAVNSTGKTPLMIALERGFIWLAVRLLIIKAAADVNPSRAHSNHNDEGPSSSAAAISQSTTPPDLDILCALESSPRRECVTALRVRLGQIKATTGTIQIHEGTAVYDRLQALLEQVEDTISTDAIDEEGQSCGVCHEVLVPANETISAGQVPEAGFQCTHIMHHECLEQVRARSERKTCPTCNAHMLTKHSE